MEYNRKAAAEYARDWALKYNPRYYHFGGIGGDCTNYISQCLFAGGAKMDFNQNLGWYYLSLNKRSPSWSGVEELYSYLTRTKGRGLKGEIWPLNKLQIGDIIQLRQNPYRYNHTVIITKIEGGQIYVCAHSNDALDKPLDSFYKLEIRPIHIYIEE